MSNTQISTYDFHNSNIRIATSEDGVILFCLADVCTVLQLANPNHAVNSIKEEFSIPTLNVGMVTRPDGSRIEANFITEPQLYFVMMRSRAKVAREFRQWICNEVLPSIRAQGAYVANNTHVDDHEAEAESQKRCWYVKQLTDLCQKYNISDEALVAAVNIAQRAFKQGYAIALNKSTDTTDKQPKADDRLTITEDEATAIDHVVHYHKLFRPDILKACKELRDIKAQAMKLVLALDNISDARLYESAIAADIAVNRLERFQLTYPKKSA
nr:MAG TPA: repressor domain protein [Caudoviricetes sp.]